MMFSLTPIVVHDRSPFVESMSTRVTAPVPFSVSSTRTLKSVRCTRSSAGYRPASARRNALSSALTGPLPSSVATARSRVDEHLDGGLGAHTPGRAATSSEARSSVITRNDSTRNHGCSHPVARRINSSSDASATSKW